MSDRAVRHEPGHVARDLDVMLADGLEGEADHRLAVRQWPLGQV